MAPIDKSVISELLTNGPHRFLQGSKQLTLAFAGEYIASTTLTAKPLLVWETESGYPRYYVPVESLHADIRAQIPSWAGDANGYSKAAIKLETIETVKGKDGSEGIIERLTIGERSTTWARLLGGPLKDHVRFERDEIDDWFHNGALFVGIRNPYKRIDTTPVAKHVIVKVDGEVIAKSSVAVLLSETGLKEAWYLPATSIKDWGMVQKSDARTACPYKGEAWYLDLTVKGKKYENLVWYYPYPTHESAGIEGFVSFYRKEGVEMFIDDMKMHETTSLSSQAFKTDSRIPVPNEKSLTYSWERR